jgi:hypothetical protein
MHGDRLRTLIRRTPFRACEIALENGDRHVVRHPESLAIGRRELALFLPNGELVIFGASEVTSVRLLARNGRRA